LPALATRQAAPNRSRNQAPPARRIPFTSASHEHTEPCFDTGAFTPAAATLNLGPFDVPSFGYLRHIFLEVTTSGAGTIGAGVVSGDYPWNLFQSITLADVNGTTIFGPMDGYATKIANMVGGYAYEQDPSGSPIFSSSSTSPTFFLRIPVEISHHDALGALANQSAASTYKVSLNINPNTVWYSTVPTTTPTMRIRAFTEAWALPNVTDIAGRPQEQQPPNHGTAQYWSSATHQFAASGQITIPQERVGNLIRNLVFISRTAAGVRSDTVFPSPVQFWWDGRIIRQDTQNYLINRFWETQTDVTRDTGVWCYPFSNSIMNRMGDESPSMWMPTVQASRVELQGVIAAAGSVQTLTNEIAPGEVDPIARYAETNAGGFHPEVGTPTLGQ
jgi:hypothetical protein